MQDNKLDLSFCIKEKIREINFHNLKIGGDKSFSFMTENNNTAHPLFALEFLYSSNNIIEEISSPNKADIISVKFDIQDENFDENEIKEFLTKEEKIVNKPLILRGANNNDIDKKLLPLLAQSINQECIIAFADENTFENIVPSVVKNNHILVLRSPIDINLAKELNILSIDKGISPDRILIDPDMGGLGYGLDYGYSIIEKIRQAAFDGDTMLNMPVIAFIGEESYRAKEAKSDTFAQNWGQFSERSVMWEISAASAMISAGANIVVLWNPKSIEVLKGIV